MHPDQGQLYHLVGLVGIATSTPQRPALELAMAPPYQLPERLRLAAARTRGQLGKQLGIGS
jgi:hypothetical protein